MEYTRIPVILKRYEFDSKMKICQEYSKDIMSINGLIDTNELRQKPLPWELETFTLFAVLTTGEYSNRSLEDRQGRKQFINIISAIKNYKHPKLEITSDSKGLLERFLIVTGLTQFPLQEDIRFRFYRYSYIFHFENNQVNMNKQFVEKFGCEYDQFKKLGFIIQCLFSTEWNKPIDSKIMDYIFSKFSHVIKHLVIEREDYISLQKKVTKDITQYMYGYNYFYQFPFIRYNEEVFLPLPHLIIHSVTSSLLSRLTRGNNQLRSLFGKEVLESYLLHLINLCHNIDEIKSEFGYNFKRNGKRTLDIMIRKGNQCLMIDSKSMSPKFGLRDLTEKDVEDTINRMVGNVMQVYRHITERFPNEYYPFCTKIDFLKENVFGAVILYEDNYIQREIIMKRVAEELNISYESNEYKYLCSNVKMINLYEFEQMMFRKDDVLQILTDNRDNPSKWFDLSFSPLSAEGDKTLRDDVSPTIESMQQTIFDFAHELVEAGIITK